MPKIQEVEYVNVMVYFVLGADVLENNVLGTNVWGSDQLLIEIFT